MILVTQCFLCGAGMDQMCIRDRIRNLTNFCAQMQLGELDLTELQALESGRLKLRLGDLTFFGTTMLSFCRSCVTNDIAQYGV